jgi:hypothetical protein
MISITNMGIQIYELTCRQTRECEVLMFPTFSRGKLLAEANYLTKGKNMTDTMSSSFSAMERAR